MAKSMPFKARLGLLVLLAVVSCSSDDLDPAGLDPGPEELRGGSNSADPYFQGLGNDGYDVDHYQLNLDLVDLPRVRGRAEISLTTTRSLVSLNLDLTGLDVDRVGVDGEEVDFDVTDGELTVELGRVFEVGETLGVTVDYSGEPSSWPVAGTTAGWIVTEDGGVLSSAPGSASALMPVNGEPEDKATLEVTVAPPNGSVAVSAGQLVEDPERNEADRSWTWSSEVPVATHEIPLAVGPFEGVDEQETISGVTVTRARRPGTDTATSERLGELIGILSGWFGPYPFPSFGFAVVGAEPGLRLGGQSLSILPAQELESDGEVAIVHEMATQWFGASVGIRDWADVWLEEAFATYAEWLYVEDADPDVDAADIAELVSSDLGVAELEPAFGSPGPEGLYAPSVSVSGALALHWLRETVGDDAFVDMLRDWSGTYRHSTADTDDFLELVEAVDVAAARELNRWLSSGAPAQPG